MVILFSAQAKDFIVSLSLQLRLPVVQKLRFAIRYAYKPAI